MKSIFDEDEVLDIKQDILDKEKEIISRHVSHGDGGTGLGPSSLTARFNHFNTLEWDYTWVKKLRQELVEGIKSLDEQGAFQEVYARGWANVMRNGEKINSHRHTPHPGFFSAHVTIATEGTSTFYRHPVDYTFIHEEENYPGKLTIFPSHYPHWTSMYRGDKERISLATDFLSGNQFLHFKKPLNQVPFCKLL